MDKGVCGGSLGKGCFVDKGVYGGMQALEKSGGGPFGLVGSVTSLN